MGGSVLKNQFEGGGSELSDQLLDPDVPTLASQDKLKVSPKGLPFVNRDQMETKFKAGLKSRIPIGGGFSEFIHPVNDLTQLVSLFGAFAGCHWCLQS